MRVVSTRRRRVLLFSPLPCSSSSPPPRPPTSTLPQPAGSKKIMQLRCEKGMTQKQVAQRLNMKQQDYQKYENGKAMLNNAMISKIEKIVGRVRPFKGKKKGGK